MRNLLAMWTMLLLFLPMTVFASLDQLSNSMSFKATMIVDGTELEWEYINPSDYEFEKGNHVTKGKEAEKRVQTFFRLLDISEKAEVENMVANLKKNGYENMDRLDVRWITEHEKLYTWVWERKKR